MVSGRRTAPAASRQRECPTRSDEDAQPDLALRTSPGRRCRRGFATIAGPCALTLVTLAAATVARPVEAVPACGERICLVAQLDARFAEKPQVIGLSAAGGLRAILASANGSWTVLITYPRRPTGVIATGPGFENIGLITAGQPA